MSDTEAESKQPRSSDDYDVVVVGGSQAAFAIGYHLASQGRRFVIFERGDRRACLAWSLGFAEAFHAPRLQRAPGLPFPGDPDNYPTRDEVIAYLEQYVKTFELPIELNSNVRRLSRERTRSLLTSADGRSLRTRSWSRPAPSRRRTFPSSPGTSTRCLAGTQHRLPAAEQCSRGNRARGRRREHGLPDRQGLPPATGSSSRSDSPETAASARRRP